MVRTKDVLNCLPLLASILGDRYGVQVRIGGKEACTNGKVIHLPSLPMDCEPELLALARSFVDHESGHIRHTDFVVLKAANLDPVTFNLFNCLEDWRIEKKLSGIFPGCRQNLNWLIRRFFVEEAQPRAGGDPPPLAVLDYVLLTVRAWDVEDVNSARTAAAEVLRQHFPGLRECWMPSCSRFTSTARTRLQPLPMHVNWHRVSGSGNRNSNKRKPEEMELITLILPLNQIRIFRLIVHLKRRCLYLPARPKPSYSPVPCRSPRPASKPGELLSTALVLCQAESAFENVTVAVEGFRQSSALRRGKSCKPFRPVLPCEPASKDFYRHRHKNDAASVGAGPYIPARSIGYRREIHGSSAGRWNRLASTLLCISCWTSAAV
jgi:hypothetical protein